MSKRQKAEYIWDYYRWHIIITLVIIATLCTFIYGQVTRVNFDVYLTYAGSGYFSSEYESAFSALGEYADDITGDGEKNLSFDQLTYNNMSDSEYLLTMTVTLEKMMADGKRCVFLLDKERLDTVLRDKADVLLTPVADWCKSDLTDTVADRDGTVYAVSLKDSTVLSGLGINTDSLYLAVGLEGKNKELYRNSVKLANELLK